MIIDEITNAHLYEALGPKIKQAFDYIQLTDLLALEVGEHELDGRSFYVIAQCRTTKAQEQGRWEAHLHHIDLHYILQGTERIGYVPLSRMEAGEYDATKDFLALSGTGQLLTLQSGDFMLLWKNEGHMPGIVVDKPVVVKKVVIKIRLD